MFITVGPHPLSLHLLTATIPAPAQHRRRQRTTGQVRVHRPVGAAAQHPLVEERPNHRELQRLPAPLPERSLPTDHIAGLSWYYPFRPSFRLNRHFLFAEDAGIYSCTATNFVGTANTTATLQVPGERRSAYI
jgi:hypothetical protein